MPTHNLQRSTDELAFLPAALEIQETPPLPMARNILRVTMLFFIFVVIWSIVSKVDIVGVAKGKIIPSGNVKIIQPLETGVVRNIYIKEGDHIEAGEELIELDTTMAGAERLQVKEQQLSLKLDHARLLTMLDQLSTDNGQLTIDHFHELKDATSSQISLQKERVTKQLDEYRARTGALKDEKRQRLAERNAISQRIQQLDSTIPLITERAKSFKDLAEKNMVPRVQWLELEQERIEQVKERDVQKNNFISLDAGIANIDQRLNAQKAEFETVLLTELADAENHIAAFEQEKVKADKRVTLQKLVAPVSGRVHRLAVHTIGGVVTPAQELMHIVPDKNAIEVEAWLPNRDIGFVHNGQKAEVKVETFPFTRYGTIDAEILDVSGDAIPDEHLGLVYAMRVKLYRTTMKVKDRIVNLSPGMAVTVEVNMGKRRLIEYLLTPLLKYKSEAVRER